LALDISALHPGILDLFLVETFSGSGVCFSVREERKEKKRKEKKSKERKGK